MTGVPPETASSSLKICLVTPRYPPNVHGGGEISAQLLAEQLNSRPDIEEVLVLSFDGESEEEIGGIRVNRLGTYSAFPLELPNAKVAAKLLARRDLLGRFDVLHGYNVSYYPALGVISELLSLPTVATLNSYALFPKAAYGVTATGLRKVYDGLFMPTTGQLLRQLTRHIDRFICLSDGSKRVYVKHGFNECSIETIPNMADPSFDVPETPRNDNKIRVLYVGSVIKRKGVKYLIAATSRLPSNFDVRIVGDGNQRDELESYASEIGVCEQVDLVGNVPYSEIEREYSNADVFVHPGIWPEPFGRTLLEAMQTGTPIVATEIGGPADIVTTDELLCPPTDAEALADAIEYAAEHRDAIAAKNRKRVVTEYAPKRVCGRVVKLYREVVGEQ